jgi:DNA-binding response OmpR family regulator
MRFLIVDNVKPSQDILKQFIMRFPNKQVDSTHYAQDVIAICRQKTYDVILLGYDLGDNQKNGQQILEELRVNKYINQQCIVILITAEVSQSMVLAALEHKPDHYICKPYSLNNLNKRLTDSLRKKEALSAIYKALDQNRPELVIKHCEDVLRANTPYKSECLAIMSEQYFDLELFDEAKTIFETYHNNKSCQWATIGLGKVALHEKKHELAETLFKKLIEHYPLYLTSYDWLAITYEAQLNNLLAEEILEQALKLSPRSLSRLKRYAHLCIQNENFDKATIAYKKNYKLARNSIHHCADNVLNYVNALTEYTPTLTTSEAKKENNKAFIYMKDMTRDFNGADIKIQSHLLSARLLKITKEDALASKHIGHAEVLLAREQMNIPTNSLQKIAKSLTKLDKPLLASQILVSESGLASSDYKISVHDENMTEKAQAAIESSLHLYKQKDYPQAIKKLREADESFPNHSGIKMNLIQVLLMSYAESNEQLSLLNNVRRKILEISALNLNSVEQERLKKMKKKYQLIAGI